MSSIRFEDDDDEDDVTAKALASITAQLQQFTSPKLGSLIRKQREQEDEPEGYDHYDSMAWMEQELQEAPLAVSTPKRTPLLERADTPVMSNSSSKKPSSRSTQQQGGDDTDDQIMEPVQTPFKISRASSMVRKPPTPYHTLTTRASSAPSSMMIGSSSSSSSQTYTHRRYHDALWSYLQAKRSLSNRMDLEQQDMDLDNDTNALATTTFTTSASSLASQECRVEVEYLRQLQTSCWAAAAATATSPSSPSPQQQEGDLWMLLVTLRRLGLSALVWDNDSISAGQHVGAQTVFLQQLAGNVTATPKELLEELASVHAPLVLQRRHEILQWIQSCLENQLLAAHNQNATTTKPVPSTTHPDDEPSLVTEKSKAEQKLLQTCLSYVLAGRVEDAKAMARSHGQPWRAAAWSGGEPEGFQNIPNEQTQTIDAKPTGNPHRFLWKRQVWKNGRRLLSLSNSTSNSSPDEAAIYSVLANDVQTCLSNPSLRRSWSQSLQAILSGIWGRMEDEVLHWHNIHRRKCRGPPYPGTEYLQQETEQLLATSGLASLTDAQAMQMLWSSPFSSSSGSNGASDNYESAMAAFLIGKSAILEYCQRITSETNWEDAEQDEETLIQLRFLTHLTLYLDSLHASSTPILLQGLTEQKNHLLFRYVQYLESRPDLWHMLALYMSLLPDEQVLGYYPTVLVKVFGESERKSMLEQIRELIPNLEASLLRQVVRLCLASSTIRSMGLDDETKCQSLQWLLQHEEHFGDALICSNMLLRDFFLNEQDDKMETAMMFVEDYLPDELVDMAGQTTQPNMDTMEANTYATKVDNARTEHLAFLSYLDAYRTFGKWKDILSETSTTVSNEQQRVDTTFLNATETNIAQQRMVKDWLREKKNDCEAVMEAAEQARTTLRNVLTHPGGWLCAEEEVFVDDKDDQTLKREITEIRARYLVLAVNLYHQVCEETASWMSRSLDNATSVYLTRDNALELLDTSKDDSTTSSAYSPSYWYQHALDLATLVAEDTHGIHKAFGSLDLQDFLSKLAETAVSKLMNE